MSVRFDHPLQQEVWATLRALKSSDGAFRLYRRSTTKNAHANPITHTPPPPRKRCRNHTRPS
jgi:hypothetical protein